jgi:tetratricopeptide (TPR) repeat protein
LARLTAKSSKGESIQFLHRFVESIGDDAEGLARAADIAISLGRADDAIEWASCARLDGRLHDRALRPLGLGYAARGEHVKAVEALEKSPIDATVFVSLLRSYLALGRLTDAETKLKSVDAVDEPTNEVKQTIELVRHLTDRRDALKKFATDAKAAALDRVACSERLFSEGKVAAAADLIEPALAGDAKCGPALGLRALIHLDRGRLAKALRDAERAIELSPRAWHGYAARGRVRFERETDGALADLEKAAELSSRKDAATLHALAAAHAKAGRTDKAVEVQREALKLRPDDKEMVEQLKEMTGK